MSPFDLSDDALVALLSESIHEAEPVPAAAVSVAKAIAQMSDVDSELAGLVADSLVDDATVLLRHDVTMEPQGEPSDRLLTFATPQLSVDLDLPADGLSVVGAITPPMSVDVDLDTAGPTVSGRTDELGRFHLTTGPGRCRLRIHAHDGAVITPWITR
ncbi:MAG: hypothetical protein QOJ52_485 [Acidimicrobiaceae bacterium]|nr:hypothetical protein [Acidimicrobiaceae bacterium]MDQ1399410.1 hypothetical protein [Acidimicrobiaceae bacterium]MDQ1418523.1 hypothetical protein [Acidimicrobiaceae bacterium]MDQ1440793.1 hypothetical protein [Acidimicrobiaceae bacterium]